jgi:hypothetical protein
MRRRPIRSSWSGTIGELKVGLRLIELIFVLGALYMAVDWQTTMKIGLSPSRSTVLPLWIHPYPYIMKTS